MDREAKDYLVSSGGKSVLITYLKYSGLILPGLVVGLLLIELLLRLLPEQMLNNMVVLHPIRHILYQTDPDIGWRLRPNTKYHYRTDEYDVLIETNSKGLHDKEYTYEKAPGVYRLLVLGDSFTEAVQVPPAVNFSRRLADCLNERYQRPIEVINSGVSYYSSAEELYFLQHEGLRYQPDLILVAFFVGNDIGAYAARKQEDGWVASLGGYLTELDEAGNLKKTWLDWANPSPYEDIPPLQRLLQRYSQIYRLLAHPDSKLAKWTDDQKENFDETLLGRWLAPPQPTSRPAPRSVSGTLPDNFDLVIYAPTFPNGPNMPPEVVETWAILQKIFAEFKQTSAIINAQLGVLILPAKEQAHEHYYQAAYQKFSSRYGLSLGRIAWNYAQPDQALSQLFTQQNISYLDLLPPLRAYDATNGPFLYFEEDGHFNQAGHQLTAEAACQWVQDRQFISETAP